MASKSEALTKAGATNYPLRFNDWHAKAIETAEKYTPDTSGDWDVTPTTQDGALDELASRLRTAEGVSGDNQTLYALVETDFSSNNAPTASDLDTGVTLPDNAIVVAVHANVLANDSGANNDGTLTLLVGDGGTAITGTIAADNTDNVELSSTGLGTKTTAATNLFWSAATQTIDQGNAKALVEYFIGL